MMTTLHWERWNRRAARFRRDGRNERLNYVGKRVMIDWLLSVAGCIGVAALLPRDVRLVALAVLLSISGYLWLAVAILREGPPASARYPTAWDAALLSFAASFAVQAALRL